MAAGKNPAARPTQQRQFPKEMKSVRGDRQMLSRTTASEPVHRMRFGAGDLQ